MCMVNWLQGCVLKNVEIGEVTLIGKEEKRIGTVDDAEKRVKGGLRLPPGDSLSVRGSALRGAWRHGMLRQAMTRKQWGLGARWRLAGGEYRQAVWSNFAWRRVGWARRKRCCSVFMDGMTCDDMSGEVHIKLLSRGDTNGEVRRAGLRAGRFVEAGPRAGSSPFLFVCGDDRVIRYTGADVDAGGAEDVQIAE
ncbi:hypothetical protein DEO72_LG5g1629 [Vigna unguiculata]|uniref:Uncharacterized protein n=1 Tax=Vigna unguiculata TaxID=3917 RepID=A0A4D6M0E1_VIGUN|nr:hypothetical protein DEO72_LG5g1629 [Vigna unguiculata]